MSTYRIPFYTFFKCIFLLLSDVLAFYFSLVIAIKIRDILPIIFPNIVFPSFSFNVYFTNELYTIFGVIVFISVIFELYQKRRTFWEELLVIWKMVFVSMLLANVLLFNFQNMLPFVSRVVLLFLFAFLAFFLPLFRLIFKFFLFKTGFWNKPILLACRKNQLERALSIAEIFSKDFYLGFIPTIIYCMDTELKEIKFGNKSLPVFKTLNQLPKDHTVFIITETVDSTDKLLIDCYSIYRRIFVIPINTVGMMNSGAQYLFSERLFIIKLENQLNSILAKFLKALTDYVCVVFIIILLSPLLLILSIIIKLTSKGPLLYYQERIGKHGQTFKVWKFRSMCVDADKKLAELLESDANLRDEWNKYFKLKNDPRITPIGHFLRKYSLDEFPQLFNVLIGNMSLVGPRPFLKGEIEEINPSLLPLYAQVKPGLTGLWQVSGRNNTDRHKRIQIDVWYLHNWSLGLDLLILLNTPFAVLSGRGAC